MKDGWFLGFTRRGSLYLAIAVTVGLIAPQPARADVPSFHNYSFYLNFTQAHTSAARLHIDATDSTGHFTGQLWHFGGPTLPAHGVVSAAGIFGTSTLISFTADSLTSHEQFDGSYRDNFLAGSYNVSVGSGPRLFPSGPQPFCAVGRSDEIR